MLTTPQPPTPVASSQIGLTQQVVWPFYDAARQRAVTAVEDPGFVTELTGRLSQGPLVVEVDAPEGQAFLLIEVTAQSPEVAALAANTAADLLLERDRDRLAAAAEADLARATVLLEASQARVTELDGALADLVPAEAAAGAAVGDEPTSVDAREALLAAQVERSSLSQRRNEELRRQVEVQIQYDEATAAVAAVVPELEILRRAEGSAEAPARSLVPVVAGIAVAVIAGLGLAIMFDRTRGALSSRWHAEQVAGVPVLADMASRRHRDRAAGLFLTGLVNGAADHGNIVALVGLKGTPTERWLATIVQYFQLAGVRVLVLVDSGSEKQVYGDGTAIEWQELPAALDSRLDLDEVSTIVLPSTAMLLDTATMRPVVRDLAHHYDLVLAAGGAVDERASDIAIALADVTVLIARKGHNRVDQLRAAARAIGERHEVLLGVVLGVNRLSALSPAPDRFYDGDPLGDELADERRPALWS